MSREELINLIVRKVAEQGGQVSRNVVVKIIDMYLAGEVHGGKVPPPRSYDELMQNVESGSTIIEVSQTPTLPGMGDEDAPAPFAITRISRGLAAAASTTPISEQLVMEYNREQEEAAQIVADELLHISGTQQYIVDGLLSILTLAQSRPPDFEESKTVAGDVVATRFFGDIKIMAHAGMPRVAIELPRAVFLQHAGAKAKKLRGEIWRELSGGKWQKETRQLRGHSVEYGTGRARIGKVSPKRDHFWIHADTTQTQYRTMTRLKHLKGVRDTEAVDRIVLEIDRRFVETMMLFVEGGKMRGAGYINVQSQLRRELGRVLPPRDTSNAYRLYLHLSLTQRTARPYSVREICQQFAPKYIKVSKAGGAGATAGATRCDM